MVHKNETMPRKGVALWLFGALIISIALNIFLSLDWLSDRADKYPYLSKRLFAENVNNIVINFVPLRAKLRDYVAHAPKRTGVYFEYLPTGVSIGVNEKDVFFSASLVKLPTVMRFYKLIDEGKIKSSKPITLKDEYIDKGFGELWRRGSGAQVSTQELIDAVTKTSDNTAFRAIQDLIKPFNTYQDDKHSLRDVYNYLDITEDEAGGNAGITPKNFSSILRSLYLSAYLPYSLSNEILKDLSESEFNDWLPEPLPQEIKIAHKFGLYNAEPHEFAVHSDCGIVYYPQRPYVLCVMVNTYDGAVAQKEIRDLSKSVYDYIKDIK
ncbi:MAG: serine hydrolase [Candidatus Berkelbacteria bacterium]|nr:MAG: serine hydrolase [Candidatus Berkelbacteria bacterium]QQG51528.1 MAG: serine hydrolase [Candidatus Berkelbacteria bacterium]